MRSKKYILNPTYGINGIDKISLKKIIKKFGFPNEIEIELSNDKIDLKINLKYDILKIYYTLNYFVEKLEKPEYHSLTFDLEKLYLNENESIKEGDELRKVLPKIKRYLKKNNKSIDFEYEEGRYLFDNGKIDIFFERYDNKKIVDCIMVSLPYEDILDDKKILEEIKDVMELKEKIEKLFFK